MLEKLVAGCPALLTVATTAESTSDDGVSATRGSTPLHIAASARWKINHDDQCWTHTRSPRGLDDVCKCTWHPNPGLECVRLLLRHGASALARDAAGRTPLEVAIHHRPDRTELLGVLASAVKPELEWWMRRALLVGGVDEATAGALASQGWFAEPEYRRAAEYAEAAANPACRSRYRAAEPGRNHNGHTRNCLCRDCIYALL